MPKKRYLEAGEIVGTHGVRGEVRVYPECDSPEVLAGLKKLYFDNGARAVRIKARAHKNMALIKLEGVDTVEAAAALRGQMLYLDRHDLKLPRGTYFIADLIGLSVVDDDNGTVYGECTDVSQTGSNDVYHLRTPEGREVLIPAIPEVIRKVDVDGGVIRIFPMLGLFDDEN
ncbi:MAG: 16S rRNA processing protein RimM [Clostridia bacterium]|nr:16S rRNA processing protein RimM [Clostridia bacterium]